MNVKSHSKKMIIHALALLCGFLLVFTLFYNWLKGQSGGDMAVVLFSVIFLVIYTLIIGLVTYSWQFKAKYGVISGLLSSYFLAYILFKLLLY